MTYPDEIARTLYPENHPPCPTVDKEKIEVWTADEDGVYVSCTDCNWESYMGGWTTLKDIENEFFGHPVGPKRWKR